MENSNSREYLEKITAAVIDNLRSTGPAPSVQMQDVPRRPFGGMTDEEEAELDDIDEDENKDVRMTEHRWDKHIQNDAELDPSDDEEMATTNGATRKGSAKRTFTDFSESKKTRNSDASALAATNGAKSSKESGRDLADIDLNDDTIEDITVAGAIEKEQDTGERKQHVGSTSKEDDDDVGMADTTVVEETSAIKEEEGEGDKITESTTRTEKAPSKEPANANIDSGATDGDDSRASASKPTLSEIPTDGTTIIAKDKDTALDAMDVDNEAEVSKEGDVASTVT